MKHDYTYNGISEGIDDKHNIVESKPQRYQKMFRAYATNMYAYDGEGINTVALEHQLYDAGMAVVCKPIWADKPVVAAVGKCEYTEENEIKKCTPLPINGHNPMWSFDEVTIGVDGVLFYDTNSRMCRRELLANTELMSAIDDAVNVQTLNQQFPLICAYEDGNGGGNDILKMESFLKRLYHHARALIIPAKIATSIQNIDLNKEYNAQELLQTKAWILNENLCYIGVDSQDAYPKAERKIVSEQEGNNDQLMLSRRDGLEPRKAGLEMSNRIWGYNQSVRCVLDDEAQPVQNEGDNNDDNTVSARRGRRFAL